MYCGKCGNKLEEGANFCNNCGDQINVISNNQINTVSQYNENKVTVESNKVTTLMKWSLVCFLMGAFARFAPIFTVRDGGAISFLLNCISLIPWSLIAIALAIISRVKYKDKLSLGCIWLYVILMFLGFIVTMWFFFEILSCMQEMG